jgi:hypothetical protein
MMKLRELLVGSTPTMRHFFTWRKIVSESQMLPAFYGVAYHDYERNQTICYPLFINLVVILWRDFKFWIKNPKGRI